MIERLFCALNLTNQRKPRTCFSKRSPLADFVIYDKWLRVKVCVLLGSGCDVLRQNAVC